MLSYSPQEASLRGKIGAYRLHATHDSREITAPARRAFLARFDRDLDQEGTLPPPERALRAAMAKRAYFTRLALKSAQARRRSVRGRNGGGRNA